MNFFEVPHLKTAIEAPKNRSLVNHAPIRHAAEPGTVDVVGEPERGGVVPGREGDVCLLGRAPRPPGVILLKPGLVASELGTPPDHYPFEGRPHSFKQLLPFMG